jgi:hypothetical protein
MRIRTYIIGAFIIIICVVCLFWLLPMRRVAYSGAADTAMAAAAAASSTVGGAVASSSMATTAPAFVVTHIPSPDPVKAIYFTSWAAGTPSFQKEMWNLLDGSTELNSIVIDVKDNTGRIGFTASGTDVVSPEISEMGSAQNRIPDIESFIAKLHARNIYVIGRITVFQDPYAVKTHPEWYVRDIRIGKPWKDAGGAYWLDPDSRDAWKYIVAIAKEAHDVGFDEINFDYVRFPSDGAISDAVFAKTASTTKAEVIKSFFSYLHDELSPSGIPISVDLFGQTTSERTDMGIGQIIEDAFPYFDYIDPMVYPSHFIDGFQGYAKPAEHPYAIVKYSMDQAVARAIAASSTPSKMRPWLQAFDLGAIYTPAMVKDQMQATYDAGLDSWLLWNAGAVYDRSSVISTKAATSTIKAKVGTTTVSSSR